MGENSPDFDLDLDIDIENIFDLLAEESETREAAWQLEYDHHTQQPTIQEQQQKKEDYAKRNSLQMNPRVMKNDIRRYYSRMLMNTINSADFNQLQSFFSTFMTGRPNSSRIMIISILNIAFHHNCLPVGPNSPLIIFWGSL